MVLIIGILFMIILPCFSGLLARKNGKSFSGIAALHMILIFLVATLGDKIALAVFEDEKIAAMAVICAFVVANVIPFIVAQKDKVEETTDRDYVFKNNIFEDLKNRYRQMTTEDLNNLLNEGGLRPEGEKALKEIISERST